MARQKLTLEFSEVTVDDAIELCEVAMNPDMPVAHRRRALGLLLMSKNFHIRETATVMGVTENTVHNWADRYSEVGVEDYYKRGTFNEDEIRDFIRQTIAGEPMDWSKPLETAVWTHDGICQIIARYMNIELDDADEIVRDELGQDHILTPHGIWAAWTPGL